VETAAEHLLVVKTTQERFAAVENRIRELHSYELPEVVAVPIVAGSENYLRWIREQVSPEGTKSR
jgi:periplasmic divalent cation tolerance protein